MIRKYGALDPIFGQAQYAQIPMAVVGIVMKFFQIVISVAIGMAAGCIPIEGYNMGAGHRGRVKKLFALLLGAEAFVGVLSLLIVEGFPRQLIVVFGASGESVYYTEFAVRAFRVCLCMIVLACINKAAFIFLQAMGRAFASTLLSMIREVVFGVGLALLLPPFFGLNGVLYSMPVADVLTFFASVVVIGFTWRFCAGMMLLKAENISEKRKTDPAALHREIKSILVGTGVSDYAGSSLFKNSLPSSKGCGFTLHRCNAGRPAHLLVYPKAAGAQNQLHDKK